MVQSIVFGYFTIFSLKSNSYTCIYILLKENETVVIIYSIGEQIRTFTLYNYYGHELLRTEVERFACAGATSTFIHNYNNQSNVIIAHTSITMHAAYYYYYS